MAANGEGLGEGMEWEVGVSRYKILYIEWINNKVLLYSTENYIQYPIINHSGEEYFKKNVYICITESLKKILSIISVFLNLLRLVQ